MTWTHDADDKISRCIQWYYGFIVGLLKVSMQITKYMFIHVIKIFIFYMVSTTTCVSINAYTNGSALDMVRWLCRPVRKFPSLPMDEYVT